MELNVRLLFLCTIEWDMNSIYSKITSPDQGLTPGPGRNFSEHVLPEFLAHVQGKTH